MKPKTWLSSSKRMILRTITTAARVVFIGQTNLTTANWCFLKGRCVSAGIMCADNGFITVTLVIGRYHSVVSMCPQHASSPTLIAFQQQHPNNSTGT